MRILIADDDLTCRTILNEVLKNGGYNVLETDNGLEALEVLSVDFYVQTGSRRRY